MHTLTNIRKILTMIISVKSQYNSTMEKTTNCNITVKKICDKKNKYFKK